MATAKTATTPDRAMSTLRPTSLLALVGLLATLMPASIVHAVPSSLDVGVADVTARSGATDVPIPVTYTPGTATQLVAVVSLPDGHGTLTLDPAGTEVELEVGYDSFRDARAIGFNGTSADVQAVLETLTWDAPASDTAPTSPNLTVSVTQRIDDPNVYYNGLNGHYYEFVAAGGTSWTDARNAANKDRLGLQGYLVTITSAAENNFVANNTAADNIWIGASDSAGEGEWAWTTGPETGAVFSSGNSGAGGPVASGGAFHAWAANEPNDAGTGEDYAVTNWRGTRGAWNDLSASAADVMGYLVEYGGIGTFTGEQATATATLQAITPSVTVSDASTTVDGDTTVGVTVTGKAALDGTLLAVVSADAGSLSITDTTGLALEYGYDAFTEQTAIGFRGTAAEVIAALEGHLTWHAPATDTSATVKVSLTEQFTGSGGTFFNPEAGTQGTVYEYVTTARSWTEARDAEHMLDGAIGRLAILADATENTFVADHVQATDIWIGATDSASEGDWRWVDDSAVDRFGWAAGEPNDYGSGEDCAVTNWRGTLGAWNDLACSGAHHYLVEYAVADMALFADADTGTVTATADRPAAPTNVRVDAGATDLAVTWDAPSSTGGGALTGYEVTAEPGGHTCASAADSTTCSLAGLTAGTDYTVSVVATNATGSSPASNPVTASPVDATVGDGGRPAASPGQRTDLPIRVTLPADRAGKINVPRGRLSRDPAATEATTVEVVVPPGLGPCIEVDDALVPDDVTVTLSNTEAAPMTATLEGPEHAVAEALDLRAVWWNPDCDTTPADAEDAGGPVDVTVTQGGTVDEGPVEVSAGHATVRLRLPAEGGTLVFDATAHPQVTATTTEDGTLVLTGPTGAVEDALATGVAWQASDRAGLYELAIELDGDGGYATRLVESLEITGAPSAPRNMTGVRDGTTLTVTWEVPETVGSTPITSYTVTLDDEVHEVAGTDPRTATFTGITTAPVQLSAAATNAEGTSAAATATVAWPGTPREVSAWAATSTTASVTWEEPAETGTATITSYTVRNTADHSESCTAEPTARECLVTWLSPGTDVTFEVIAHSAAGTSDPATSNQLRLVQADLDGGTDPTVDLGDTTPVPLPFSLDLPAGFGDGTTDDGTVTAVLALPEGAGTLQVDEAELGGATLDADRTTGTTVVLTGSPTQVEAALANALTWVPGALADTYRLEADVTEDGGSLATRLGTWLRVVGPPAPPSAPSAIRSGTTITATWLPPARDGGSAVTAITVSASDATCSVAAPARTCQLTGMPASGDVAVQFTATNADGLTSAPARVLVRGASTLPTDEPSEPVRDADGQLPAPPPGASESTVDGVPSDTTIGGDGEQVIVQGDGFALSAQPVSDDGEPTQTVVDTRILVPATGGVRVQTEGFQPRSTVSVWLFSEPRLLGTLEVTADGTLEDMLLPIPDDVLACSHTLQAVGTTADGRDVSVSLGIQVLADPFPFGDTDPTGVHAPAIGCLESRGVVDGFVDSPYRPARDTIRAEAAAMLARVLDLDTTGAGVFEDTEGVLAGAIAALADAGVVSGYPDGTFQPGNPLTRGELAALVVRAGGLATETHPEDAFSDVGDGPLSAAISTAAANGLVLGFSDGTFRPGLSVTRGEAATMLERLVVLLERTE